MNDQMLRSGRASARDVLSTFGLELHSLRVSDYGRELAMREAAKMEYPPIAGGASLSDFLENKVLDHILGKTSYTLLTPIYLAPTTVVPTDASTGATITEPTYTGYARKAIAATDWNAASSGSSTTANTLTFAACTAGSSTIIGFAICDASGTGAGNMLVWGTCSSVVVSTTQTPLSVAAGALTVTAD